jgi:hypothetical protein
MPENATVPPVPPATVETLLALAGVPAPDAGTLARIATGAGQAFAAVANGASDLGFDDTPDGFLAELERLADERD